MNRDFWAGRRVFVTGHTGFKGAWLATWLRRLGAQVTGYALAPPTVPSLFALAHLEDQMTSLLGDVRDFDALRNALVASSPSVVFHLAAQSLVRASYEDPIGTYSTNVHGTANLLQACRDIGSIRAIVIVTSDKCYANRGIREGYREDDPLGGDDPYSSSKAAAELVTAAYRRSFFRDAMVASVRAGNVIGGGDWAADRLIPDLVRALQQGEPVRIRNPHATRPWQHVLDPLHGYLMLAERVTADARFASAWNFGPDAHGEPVIAVVEKLLAMWGEGRVEIDARVAAAEAAVLHVDSTRAKTQLGWSPRLPLQETLEWTARWYRAQAAGAPAEELMARDLAAYEARLAGVAEPF